jgi:DNA-binding NarL/FixJ family response regulator
MGMKVRVLLVDDHHLMREGLRGLLQGQAHYEVVGEAENGRAAAELVRDLQPDVVVMDVTMPELNGIDATHQIIEDGRGPKVVALSMHSDRQFVSRMLAAGASGYLPKDCAFEELSRAINEAVKGRVYLSPKIAPTVVDDYVKRLESSKQTASDLTPREREVLQLLAEGQTTHGIAAVLGISPKTVETHRRNTMQKLQVDSVAGLTRYALRHGLTPLDG